MRFVLLAAALTLGSVSVAFAQDNPFASKSAESTRIQTFDTPPAESSIVQGILHWQKQFHEDLSKTIRAAKDAPWSWEVLLLVAFSFLYGVLHTLLPGHQKAVIGAYFLSENARYGQGFVAGILFAIFHATTAIAVLLFMRFVLHLSAGASLQQASFWMQWTAAIGVMAIGVGLFLFKLRRWGELKRKAELDRVRRLMGFDLHDRLETSYEPLPWKKFLPLLFFAAILPCPGTLIVIFFALGLGVLEFGLIAVVAISLGMAATLVALALFVIWLKKRSARTTFKTPGRVAVFAIESIGLLAIVGFSLFWLVIGQPT